MDTLFLDANVLFSAAWRQDARVRRLWDLPNVALVTSTYAAEEARRNLQRAEQRSELGKLLTYIRVVAIAPVSRPIQAVDLPEKDRPILLAAIGAGATHLLTGDLTHFGPYFGQTIEGLLILAPADYLRARSS